MRQTYEFRGKWMTAVEIAAVTGLSKATIHRRARSGMSLEAKRAEYMGKNKKRKLYPFRGEMHTAEHIASVMGYGVQRVYERLMRGTPLDMPVDVVRQRALLDGIARRRMKESGEHDIDSASSDAPMLRNDALSYEEDLEARVILRMAHRAPTLDELGCLMGCSRERIRQLEESALKNALKNARRMGCEQELRDELRERAATQQDHLWDRIEGESLGSMR